MASYDLAGRGEAWAERQGRAFRDGRPFSLDGQFSRMPLSIGGVMRKILPVAAILMALLVFVGNFHVLTGSKGPRVVPRVSFALSEFLVNEDALRNMPALVLAIQYPLAAMALKADDERQIEKARKIANE